MHRGHTSLYICCPNGAFLCKGEVGVLAVLGDSAPDRPHESQLVDGLNFIDARARGRKKDRKMCGGWLDGF